MKREMDYEKLYETCYMQVYSYLMTLCRNVHMAEDLTQETFVKAMSAGTKSSYRGESGEVTWLCTIAKNLFFDEIRKRKHSGELPEQIASEDDVEQSVIDDDLSFRIHTALHSLEEPYKEVFSLRVFGELPYDKIGQLFGKTENWARVTYHRAKLKIQERMKSS